jgi:hypothetical protein
MNIRILFSIISLFLFCKVWNQESVLLEWKITKGDTLKYATTMQPVREPVEIDEDLLKSEEMATLENLMKLKESLSNFNLEQRFVTYMFVNPNHTNWIDINTYLIQQDSSKSKLGLEEFLAEIKELTQDEKKERKKNNKKEAAQIDVEKYEFNNFFNDFAKLNQNIVLRGRVTNTGELISTYYKNSQRNLISILFELPNKSVKIGEPWKLNMSMIEMDQHFICDSLNRVNKVFIEQLLETNDDTVAVVKYNISEYVDGNFNNPLADLFGKKPNGKIYMSISYTATGHFSISKGKWISYEGEMEIDSNFQILDGKSKTIYRLQEIESKKE